MGDLNADFGTVGVHAVDQLFERLLLLVIPQAQAIRADATVRRDIGHLDDNQADTTDSAAGVVHKMPIVRHTVGGRILTHRRHHHAVFEFEIF